MSRAVASVGVLLVLVAAPAARCQASISDSFETSRTAPIVDALARSVGRALPVTAASAGVTYTFDPATHAFERETTLMGQLFLEHARTLGRSRWNFQASYAWVRLDSLDGQPLDDLHDPGPPIVDPMTGQPFRITRFALGLETQLVTLAATYGLLDDLDVNVTLPIVYTRFDLDVAIQDVASAARQHARRAATRLGPGDLVVRGKYRLLAGARGGVAAGLAVRAPTGDEGDFQGTGAWQVSPMLLASTAPLATGDSLRWTGHVNAGLVLDAGDVGQSEGRWGVGVDCAWPPHATLAVGILGREVFEPFASAGFFDVARIDAGGRRSRAPLFGLQPSRASAVDLSLGARVNLWRDTLIAFVNVLVPLADAPVSSDPIPLAGLEAVF